MIGEVCLAGRTLVAIGDTLAHVGDLEGEVLLPTIGGYTRARVIRGEKPVPMLRATTRKGYELRAMGDTRVLTADGLKSLSMVEPGDSFTLVKGFGFGGLRDGPAQDGCGNSGLHGGFVKTHPALGVSHPESGEPGIHTWERAFILALEFATELRMPRRSRKAPIVLGLAESELLDRATFILRSWGVGHSTSRETLEGEDFWLIDFEKPEFLRDDPEARADRDLEVSLERIMPAPRRVVAAFLCGLLSSMGTVEGVERTDLRFCFGPAPRPLLGEVQILLLALGVNAGIGGDRLVIPTAELPVLLDNVGLASPQKVGTMLAAVISSPVGGSRLVEEFTDTADLVEQLDEPDPVTIAPIREENAACGRPEFVLGGFVLGGLG